MTPPSPLDLRRALSPVVSLMRWNAAIRASLIALLFASTLWGVAFLLSKFFLVWSWTIPFVLFAGLAAVVVAGVIAASRGAGIAEAAHLADVRLGLKERLSTVWELDRVKDASEMAALVRRDAAAHLSRITPRELAPVLLPRVARWTLAALAVVGILTLLPGFHSKEKIRKQVEVEAMKTQGEKLELMVRRVMENPAAYARRETPEELKKVDELAQRLSGGTVTKADALRELTRITDDLKRREQTLSSKDGVKPLDRESWRERESYTPEQQQALQAALDALQAKLGPTPPTDKALRKLSQALKQTKENMKDVKMGTPESAAIEQAMSQAANHADAAQLTQVADELRKAIDALEGADVSKVFKHLDDAIADLDEAKKQVEAMKQLQQQAAKAGKDLAEQLERGQTKLAEKTLQDFQKQVDQAEMKPEERKQMANELMKALGPARDYGELGQKLQQAMDQANAGDQKGLSQTLQEAKKQLQEAGDKQQQQMEMAQMINELQRTGCMLGMCGGPQGQDLQQQQQPMLGFNPNGKNKPGSGVGTWTEDGQGAPDYTEKWDNTGINRPDMMGKGHTGRGEPVLPQGTQNFGIRGTLGTGGPMPGISLQGISIKGESNVKIEEAFSAASQEAESALSKETVPTAYQGAVKEYFDLK